MPEIKKSKFAVDAKEVAKLFDPNSHDFDSDDDMEMDVKTPASTTRE